MTAAFCPFPLFTISGAARERGVQYGRQARHLIERSLHLYLAAWGAGSDARRAAMMRRAVAFGETLREAFPELYDEIEGIAEGSGFDIAEVIALNARTELLYGPSHADGCTGAAICPERSDGRMLIGQNWDWRPAARETAIILRILPDRGPAMLTFVEAGMLARSGLNESGIGLCGNFLQSDRDFRNSGVPIPVVRRAILSSTTLPEAVGKVLRAARSGSSNHMIAHRDGEAIDLEASPEQVFPLFPEGGILTHSNHFKAPVGELRDVGLPRYPDSLFRDRRVRRHLDEAAGPLTEKDLMAAFSDHFGLPDAVCRHRAARPDGTEIETVASVIMDLHACVMWICAGPVCMNQYVPVALHETRDQIVAA